MLRQAHFSNDGKYRYTLWRCWAPLDKLVGSRDFMTWILLNPSTADAEKDDPTIRRCIGYAREWGFEGMYVYNLFALRATDPQEMMAADNPIGEDVGVTNLNDVFLRAIGEHGVVVAGWGVNGGHMNRGEQVLDMLRVTPQCLTQTKDGHPGHPLYLKKTLRPEMLRR